MIYKNLSQEELYDLLRAYDIYIYKALESDLFKKGWQSHDVTGFYREEYETVWKNRGDAENADYDCWNYMHSYEPEENGGDSQ
jgi:hypothetical protein